MRREIYLMLIACWLLMIMPSACEVSAAPMPPGSFVSKPIASVGDLVSLTMNSQTTAQRFARHFGVTQAELVEYFRNHLEPGVIQQPGTYTVYFTSKGGRIGSRRAYLPAGERILVSTDGTPVILLKCGNPMLKQLPKIPERVVRVMPIVETLTPPPAEATPAPLTVALAEPSPISPTMEFLALAPLAEPAVDPPVVAEVLGFAEVATYVLPALLGAVVVSKSHSVVPEPTSLIVLGMGTTSVLFHLRRRATSRHLDS